MRTRRKRLPDERLDFWLVKLRAKGVAIDKCARITGSGTCRISRRFEAMGMPLLRPGVKPSFDHDRVLEMWQAGASVRDIVREVGARTFSAVRKVVWDARNAGDPRAVWRYSKQVSP
jgi:hypothetical protein